MSEWSLTAVEEIETAIDSVIAKAVSEAINIALADADVAALIPYRGSVNGKGDGVNPKRRVDPLDVDVVIPLHSDGDMYEVAPTLTFNLRAIVQYELQDIEGDEESTSNMRTIASALIDLAHEIQRATGDDK